MVKNIKLRLSGNVKGDVELNQKTLCTSRLSKGYICNILEAVKGFKLELSGHAERVSN